MSNQKIFINANYYSLIAQDHGDETERFFVVNETLLRILSNKQLVNLFILSNHVVSWRKKSVQKLFHKD